MDFVTGSAADLLHLEENGVGVAVDVDFTHLLNVATHLALAPEFVARGTEVAGPAGAQRLFVRLAIHPGHHQHLAGVGVLGDRGDETAGCGKVDHGPSSLIPRSHSSYESYRTYVTDELISNETKH